MSPLVPGLCQGGCGTVVYGVDHGDAFYCHEYRERGACLRRACGRCHGPMEPMRGGTFAICRPCNSSVRISEGRA